MNCSRGAAPIAFALIVLSLPLLAQPRQERPGVPTPVAQPNFTVTRHGDIFFEASVARPDAHFVSRVVLKETIEVAGVKSPAGWLDFVHAFAAATGKALLDAMPPSASRKKGKVIVNFALRPDGTLSGAVSLARTSGDASIDAATELAVAKAAPFQALPSNAPAPVANFRVTFAYNHPPAPAPAPAKPNGDSL